MPSADEFVFTGVAIAFGARLDVPRLREVKGSIALPGVGGSGSVQEGPADLGGLVRFRYATSSVSGECYDYAREKNRPDMEYETRATCTMEGLEFADVLRADFVSATLLSAYVDNHRFVEETVTLRGLWADGKFRRIERRTPDVLRKDCRTLKDLLDKAQGAGQLAPDPERLRTLPNGRPSPDAGKLVKASSQRLLCYLFEPSYITFVRGPTRYEIFLGEYVLYQEQRRLTMLRIEASPAPARQEKAEGRSGPTARPPTGGGPPPDDDPVGSSGAVQLIVNGHKPP